jgi:hypothetical protein
MWGTPFVYGSAKTELDVQEPATLGSHTPVEYHCSGRPKTSRLPIKSGRMVLPVPVKVWFVMTVIGLPVCPWVMTESCHPCFSWLPLKGRS